MKRNRWMIITLLLTLALSTNCMGQGKTAVSPFERYRKSSVNELEFRQLKFDVAVLRVSHQPAPLLSGLGAPFIEGETTAGKLIIEVDVYASDLPQTVDARKGAMLQAVNVARAAFTFAFGVEEDQSFDKWVVVQFFDDEKFLKPQSVKPVDPYIGIYENGELVLR